jgi:hypothetical protein
MLRSVRECYFVVLLPRRVIVDPFKFYEHDLKRADVSELGHRFKQYVINFLDQAIKHVVGRGRRFLSLSGRTLGESIFALCRGPLALRLEFKALLKPSFHGQGLMAGVARQRPDS